MIKAGVVAAEKKKNHLLLPEIEHRFLCRPARKIGAIPTELSRIPTLSYAVLYTFSYFNWHTLFNKITFYVSISKDSVTGMIIRLNILRAHSGTVYSVYSPQTQTQKSTQGR